MDIANSVPLFTGTGVDYEEWVTKLQDYFEAYDVEGSKQLPLARLRIGDSSRILAGMQYTTLSDLLACLKTEYGAKKEDDFEKLFRVSQNPRESVAQFARRVQQLHTRTSLPESYLRKAFIGGLSPAISSAVHVACPVTFERAVEAAKYHEDAMADRSAAEKFANRVPVSAAHGRDNAYKPAREPVHKPSQQQHQQQHPPRQAPPPRPDVNDLAKQMSKLSLQLANAAEAPSSHLYDHFSSSTSEQPVVPAIRSLLEETQNALRGCDLTDNKHYDLLMQCNAMLEQVDILAGDKRPLSGARPHQGPLQRQRFEGFTPEAVDEDLRRRQTAPNPAGTGPAPAPVNPPQGEAPRATPAAAARRPVASRSTVVPADPIEQLAGGKLYVTPRQYFSSSLPAAQQLVKHATTWMDSAERAYRTAFATSAPADPMETSNLSAHAHASTGPLQPTTSKFTPTSFLSANSGPLYVSAKVGGILCKAIVDTGSSNTVLSQRFVRRAGLLDSVKRSDGCFYTAAGSAASLWGVVPNIFVGIGEFGLPVDAHVTEALTYDVLIGMDWLVMAGASIDIDGNKIIMRSGLNSVVTAPLLESGHHSASNLYEHGTVHGLVDAGFVNLYEGPPWSFPLSICDSEENYVDLNLYSGPSAAKFEHSHQDVVIWSSEPKPFGPGETIDMITSPDIFVDLQSGNPFLSIIFIPCGVCGRYIPCSSSSPGHQPVFCPDCYGGLLEIIFQHDMHLLAPNVT